MLEELLNFLQDVYTGDQAGVLVLMGRGKTFSAGADLSMMGNTAERQRDEIIAEASLFYDCFDSLYRLPIPSIAYAHGGVHGGANGLLAACDFCYCDAGTRFSFGEVRFGLVPATVAPFVVRRTGITRAKHWMLGAYGFDAAEAKEAGLVDGIFEINSSDQKILELSAKLAGNAPGAVSATKKLLLDLDDKADQELRRFCTGLIAQARMTDEAKEGITAFFEKREPSWKDPGFN
jgi:methylglutaconyl-CoA hydratase